MQMENRLPAIGICIDDNAIAILGKPLIPCDFGCSRQQTSNSGSIGRRGFVQRSDMFAWNDQNMRRSLWVEVVKRNAHVVLMYQFRRHGAVSDLTKNTIVHNFSLMHLFDYSLAGKVNYLSLPRPKRFPI